jgi:hypothetical protein
MNYLLSAGGTGLGCNRHFYGLLRIFWHRIWHRIEGPCRVLSRAITPSRKSSSGRCRAPPWGRPAEVSCAGPDASAGPHRHARPAHCVARQGADLADPSAGLYRVQGRLRKTGGFGTVDLTPIRRFRWCPGAPGAASFRWYNEKSHRGGQGRAGRDSGLCERLCYHSILRVRPDGGAILR